MKYFDWNEEKNEEFKRTRSISFEIVLSQIELGNVLDVLEHPNKDKYQHQHIIVIE